MTSLNLRAIPITGKVPSPAKLMFGRSISTLLPRHENMNLPEKLSEWLKELRETQDESASYDRSSRQHDLAPMYHASMYKVENILRQTRTDEDLTRWRRTKQDQASK